MTNTWLTIGHHRPLIVNLFSTTFNLEVWCCDRLIGATRSISTDDLVTAVHPEASIADLTAYVRRVHEADTAHLIGQHLRDSGPRFEHLADLFTWEALCVRKGDTSDPEHVLRAADAINRGQDCDCLAGVTR